MRHKYPFTSIQRLLPLLLMTLADYIGASAQTTAPEMLHPSLGVHAAIGGLTAPIGMAFLGPDDFFLIEKSTGRVQRIVDGEVQSAVLDLAVNFASERGLLGLALHPQFPATPHVYLYWTESSTAADTSVPAETPLLGNRVDRFIWDGSLLTFDRRIASFRALQPADEPRGETSARGNHNGGVLAFGPDDKLYIFVGDVGRRGQMQNLAEGPFGDGSPDDAFGGPLSDDAHFTGVVVRLNDDGSIPADNPFFAVGAAMGGEIGANLQKLFSYGHRNGFGMAFDPVSGDLWLQEHGDDAFDELNRVVPGSNGGWIQFAGPSSRVAEFKAIETDPAFAGLQQLRWPPSNIADNETEALDRLFLLPGAVYSDPEFSWKYAVAPAGIGFVQGDGLGAQFEGDLFVGAATAALEEGYLFRFRLAGTPRTVSTDDSRLEDKVADNTGKYDPAESESLLIGRRFGVVTDIETGPNGNLFAVSLSQGTVYEIFSLLKAADVNGDGEINAVDVQTVVNAVLGIDTGFPCDINKDGEVNAVDVQLVVNAVLGVLSDSDA